MSPLDPELPPPGEEIHLPGPSWLPIFTALGITFAVVGLTTITYLTYAGLAITVVCVLLWIRDTRRDIEELPSR